MAWGLIALGLGAVAGVGLIIEGSLMCSKAARVILPATGVLLLSASLVTVWALIVGF